MSKYKKGKTVTGIVLGIETYGIFVKFDEFYSGLIHISEISHQFVSDPKAITEIGDQITVQILEVDEINYRLKLSLKDIEQEGKKKYKANIKETPLGFSTLAKKLPEWIVKNLENQPKR